MNNNNDNKKIIGLFVLFLIWTIAITICFEVNSHRTVSALSEVKVAITSTVTESTSNVANEIISAITEISSKADTIIENETAVLGAVTGTSNPESSSDITISENTAQRFMIGEEVPLPTLSTEPKLFMDYRSYNLWYTPHYRLQQAAYTDKDGLRRFGEDYIVALGKYYSESIGDRFQVTLDTGVKFTVIFGDGKAPCDCDVENMYAPCVNYDGEKCANVLEFIIDNDVLSADVYSYGSIDCMDKFKGNIIKMVYLGRDNSADWDLYEVR